jgi:hypothetical protein
MAETVHGIPTLALRWLEGRTAVRGLVSEHSVTVPGPAVAVGK